MALRPRRPRTSETPLFVDESTRLDPRTKAIGLAGVARARQVLAEMARRAEAAGEHGEKSAAA